MNGDGEGGGVSNIWDEMGLDYYDDLIMDDIRVGFDGFHSTKEIDEAFISPYNRFNKNESKKYKKMKYIHYEFTREKLLRKWIENRSIKQEAVMYVHMQKRKMLSGEAAFEKFTLIPNQFIDDTDLSIEFIRKNCENDSIRNKMLWLKNKSFAMKMLLETKMKKS